MGIQRYTWCCHDWYFKTDIVAGSVIVVAFAGSSTHDYCLAVLLVLFKRDSTIAFLTVVSFFIAAIFVFIVVVEKNLDLKNRKVNPKVITKTLDKGRITSVEAINVDETAPQDSNDDLVVTVSESKRKDGVKERRMVFTSNSPRLSVPDIRVLEEIDTETGEEVSLERDFSTVSELFHHRSFRKSKDDDEIKSIKSIALVFTLESDKKSKEERPASTANEITTEKEEKNEPVEKVDLLSKLKRTKIIRYLKSVQFIPRLAQPIPLTSFLVRVLLPFSYASLGVCNA
jgi:hypothetical protein